MALTLTIDMVSIAKSIDNSSAFLNAFIPFLRNPAVKEEFGQRYIDEMIERMDRGIDKDGRAFQRYSRAYKQSEAFQAFGKTNDVNLKLRGSMRASLDVVKTTATGVTIGFNSKKEERKAIGHVEGRGNLPVRDFFGLPKKEEEALMKSVVREFKDNNLDTIQFPDLASVGLSPTQALALVASSTPTQVAVSTLFADDFFGDF